MGLKLAIALTVVGVFVRRKRRVGAAAFAFEAVHSVIWG